jgi:hypothetical protein
MPIFTHTVTHGLFLDGGVDALPHLFDVVEGLADDLDYTDGRILITVSHNGTMTSDALSGSLVMSTTIVDNVYAIREFPSSREIDQSNGKIRVGDRKFHYKTNAASFVPQIGDRVVADGIKHEIVAVDIQTLGTRYLVYCRA